MHDLSNGAGRKAACEEGIGIVNNLNAAQCYSMSLASAVRILISDSSWLLTWPSNTFRVESVPRSSSEPSWRFAELAIPSGIASRKASFIRIHHAHQLTFEEFHEAFGETKASCHGDHRGGDGHSCAARESCTHARVRAYSVAEAVDSFTQAPQCTRLRFSPFSTASVLINTAKIIGKLFLLYEIQSYIYR